MNERPALRYGRVVYAWFKDRRGFAKLRPALVVTPDGLIKADGEVAVAAITTTFPQPPPPNHIPLPWNPRDIVSTRLRERSAVVLDWQSVIHPEDVVGFGGDVPPKLMLRIEEKLDEMA